jgi:hypothetical protein
MMHAETGLEQVNLPHTYDMASPRLSRMQSPSTFVLKYTDGRTKRHPVNALFFTQQQHSQRTAFLVCLH